MKEIVLRRLIAGLCMLAVMTGAMGIYAAPEAETTATEAVEEMQEEQPKTDSQGRPIPDGEETVILIEQTSGAVLYEVKSNQRMYPASTTKIMTGLLAAQALHEHRVSPDTQVTVTAEMLQGLAIDGSSISLKEGEILTFEQLLRGMMIPSGNDAAMAIAFALGGTLEGFLQQMNDKAAELGLSNTHFTNPHGLHDENHYTTAADLAKISQAAMQYEEFRDVVDIAHVKIPPTNKTEKERYYINTNGLISAMRYRDYAYKGATGIKTGSTTEAGKCLVSSATRNGMALICVVLNAKDVETQHEDSIRLLDWGFENFESILGVSQGEILGECRVKQARGKDTVTLTAAQPLTVVVPKGTPKEELEIRLHLPEALYAPIAEGERVAEVSVHYNGQELSRGSLGAFAAVERSFFWPAMALGEWLWSLLLVRIVTYVLLGVLGVFVLLMVRRIYRAAKSRKRRTSGRMQK